MKLALLRQCSDLKDFKSSNELSELENMYVQHHVVVVVVVQGQGSQPNC